MDKTFLVQGQILIITNSDCIAILYVLGETMLYMHVTVTTLLLLKELFSSIFCVFLLYIYSSMASIVSQQLVHSIKYFYIIATMYAN